MVDDLLCRGQRVVLVDPHGGVPKEILGGSEVLVLGANRSSKTQWLARSMVKLQVAKPRARTWSFHTSGPTSIAVQQPRFYEYIPPEWRKMKKDRSGITKVSYSQANGFTENNYVLPNGSQHWFLNYKQDLDTIEGDELDAAGTDELVPKALIDTLRFRLVTRKGILFIVFTPVRGYTPLVKDCLDGAETIIDTPAPLLPIIAPDGTATFERVPRVMQSRRDRLKIVFFHSTDNPFGGAEELIDVMGKDSSRETILCRAYGVPTKAVGVLCPKFKTDIHVIDDALVPEEGTNTHWVDPCSGRNFAMIWVRALPDDTLVIYREWPCQGQYIPGVGDPGEWAVPDGDRMDGAPGPAQDPFGWGFERYHDEIRRLEKYEKEGEEWKPGKKTEVIFDRYMDSRAGNSPVLAQQRTETLMDSFEEYDLFFAATSGKEIDQGTPKINDLLDYESSKPIDHFNRPKLLIARSCKNTIFALQTMTGMDGSKGACKDFFDLVRYMAMDRPQYLGGEILRPRTGGGSY